MSDPVTVQSGDFTVTSTTETAEQLTANLAEPTESEPDLSKAASDLGKKGGEAAAAAREAKARQERRDAKAADAGAVRQPVDGSDADDSTADRPPAEAKTDSDAAEKPLGKPRDDPRARMLEATRKEAEAKRERDAERYRREAAERRLAELERGAGPKPQDQPQTRQQAPTGTDKPKVEDFENYEDFVEARASYAADQRFAKLQRDAHVQNQARQFYTVISKDMSSYLEGVAGVPENHPEFVSRYDAALANVDPSVKDVAPSWTVPEGTRHTPQNVIADEYLIAGKKAPALMMHFTEHPEEYQRILSLPSRTDIQVEVRMLAKSLDAAPTATALQPQISRAKPPVRPVAGSPHTADAVPGEDASFDEHIRYYNAKEQRRR